MVHPSNFHLECFQTDTLPPDEQEQVEYHAAACEECQRYLTELEAEQRALDVRMPAEALLERLHNQEVSRRKPVRWLRWSLAPVTAGALAIGILMSVTGPDREVLRPRGKPTVTVHSPRGIVPTNAATTQIERGAALRFQVSVPASGFVTLFFVDEAGEVTWFAPEEPRGTPVAVGAGKAVLPGSAMFDETSAGDRVFLVYRRQLFDPMAVAQRVATARRAHLEVPLDSDEWVPEEESLWTITLVSK